MLLPLFFTTRLESWLEQLQQESVLLSDQIRIVGNCNDSWQAEDSIENVTQQQQ